MATKTTLDGSDHTKPRGGRGTRDPVLRSKITVPGLPEWLVSRPRIEKRVAEGVQGPLTVVTGPPGAGKTMAIASWAAANGAGPIAWVTLDEFDNRPRTFWSYVVAALRKAGAAVPGASSALAHGEATGHVFLLRLASALAGHDPPVVLVLDDLHLIQEQATLAGLGYVLRNARSGLHLVVASRIDPLLQLHRYRLTGDLIEIRADELAFTIAEAALLMEQHGVKLPTDALEFVIKRDEGWAAGLRMAALSMHGHPDPEQFIRNLGAEDGAVASYLVEEVLNTQPSAIRDILLSTSILSRVSADLATEVTGHRHAASALSALARANAFVQPVGPGWYRYHALFRDVLRLKLRREQPNRVADLHRRAARWYQANGMLAVAVGHAREAGDRQLAARIIVDELAVGQLVEPYNGDLPVGCFRQLPDATAQPQSLLAASAVALPDGRDQAAEEALTIAEQMLAALPDDQEVPSRLAAAIIRLAMARRSGELPAAAGAAAAAWDLFQRLPQSVQAGHPEGRAHVLSGRGAVEFWSGNFDAAASLFAAATSVLEGDEGSMQPTGHEFATSRGHMALLEALNGRRNGAAELAARAILVPADGGAGQPCPSAAVALALVHLERNELNGARNRLKAASAALRTHPDKLVSGIACLVAARCSLAEGRAPAAAEMLRRARSGWCAPAWLDHALTVAQSQVYAATGDIQAATDAAVRARPESALDAAVALTRARLAAGDLRGAKQALGDRAENPPPDAADVARIEAWLMDALLHLRGGDSALGRRSLEHAVRLAEPESVRLPFAMERNWLRPALGRLPELADTHRKLLDPGFVGSARRPAHQATAGSQSTPMIVEQLTSRERDVLRRVGELLSTAEIASEMYISVNTVKTHLKSIFRKLGAADRREAVRRARQLGLV